MVKRALIILIVLSFVVMMVSSCKSLTGRTAGQTVKDSEITTELNAKIVKDPELHYLKIDVDTFQGNVTLSGTVPSKQAEQRLIEYAKGVNGVKSVKSNLVIQAPQSK